MASSASAAREYDSFFQTTDTLAATGRRAAKAGNKRGRPVSVGAKLSAIASDPASFQGTGLASRVYVAGADGRVRRVKVPPPPPPPPLPASGVGAAEQKGEGAVDLTLAGPKAPLTCLMVVPCVGADGVGEAEGEVQVFAGCWDKCVYAWRVRGGKQPRAFRGGHDDFVKCLAVYQTKLPSSSSNNESTTTPQTLNILISGSADRSLVFWDATTGKRLSRQPGFHKTSLYALAISPNSSLETSISITTSEASTNPRFLLYSGSSDGEIRETEFAIRVTSELTISPTGSGVQLREIHPTSVYALAICSGLTTDDAGEDDDDDDTLDEQLELASASADGTAAISRHRGSSNPAKTEEANDGANWSVASRVTHGSHVRCLAAGDAGNVYTGGRDEDVKLWDVGNGDLLCVFDGHFDEVTGLVADGVGARARAVSCSLDGTVRFWDREEMERAEKRRTVGEGDDGGVEGGEEMDQEGGGGGAVGKKSMLTIEEEAELAELMEDSD